MLLIGQIRLPSWPMEIGRVEKHDLGPKGVTSFISDTLKQSTGLQTVLQRLVSMRSMINTVGSTSV